MARNTDPLRLLVTFTCAYEVAALTTRKMPTISHLCWKHKVLTPVILVGLAVHLLRPPVVR